ncbi:MAG: hypothetical protein M0027_15270 [Candidatus Dormibacteraeota bacterium]|nr:hypothetical protein [Candidatus Dormibacteraeota bacterium]
MKIPVAANGDLIIPRQLVAELVAEPGEECFVELDDAGTRITVARMDPGIARAYGPSSWTGTPIRSSARCGDIRDPIQLAAEPGCKR